MQIINRLSFFLVAFLLGYSSVYSQTQADVKMGEILNGGDLFQLRKEYPNLKGSVSVKMLNLVADAQLGIGFNNWKMLPLPLTACWLITKTSLGRKRQ